MESTTNCSSSLDNIQVSEHPPCTVVFFDSECVLCNRSARFLMKHDTKRRLKFSLLGSPAARRLLARYEVPDTEAATFLLLHEHVLYARSEAAIRVLELLGGAWKWLRFLRIFPLSVRDALYRFVAAMRYRLMGRVESCGLLSEAERERIIYR